MLADIHVRRCPYQRIEVTIFKLSEFMKSSSSLAAGGSPSQTSPSLELNLDKRRNNSSRQSVHVSMMFSRSERKLAHLGDLSLHGIDSVEQSKTMWRIEAIQRGIYYFPE